MIKESIDQLSNQACLCLYIYIYTHQRHQQTLGVQTEFCCVPHGTLPRLAFLWHPFLPSSGSLWIGGHEIGTELTKHSFTSIHNGDLRVVEIELQ